MTVFKNHVFTQPVKHGEIIKHTRSEMKWKICRAPMKFQGNSLETFILSTPFLYP
jgi:hypothetical protein